jgi:hypothetical protein
MQLERKLIAIDKIESPKDADYRKFKVTIQYESIWPTTLHDSEEESKAHIIAILEREGLTIALQTPWT